jgi:hypothetical protein
MTDVASKTLYALEHVSDGRSRGIVEPGQVLRADTAPHVTASLLERGLITDSKQAADRAAAGEREYRDYVENEVIPARSQSRETVAR